ncbi:MAG: prolipoprotein diacylglyceryl transferase [Oscillospiraceae bacterium]|nr:prolipoprotein diacylglyceryl transferase [Oscillospiraceae bacterium]
MFLLETIQRESVIRFPFLGNLTLNPPASFSVFGREIYFYGVIIALGFVLGILYCAGRAPEFGIRSDDVYDMMIWLIPLSILGARLYFVLFQAEYYFAHPVEILAVWEGGLAIYGGIIAGVLIAFVFCRMRHISFPAMLDLMSFGVLIGQAIGRWGNFFNREAFGAETEVFCRMGLTAPDGTTVYVHPTFLYESLWNLIGLLFLIRFSRSGRRRYNGQIALMYFFWYGLGRSWIEGLRADSLYLAHTGIRVSQLLSVLILCVSATILFINRNKKTAVGPGSVESNPEAGSEGRI